MGRPPLQVRKTTIRLPVDVFDRITALVGERRMAEFIRDAVVAEVEKREAERGGSSTPAESGEPEAGPNA